MAAASAPAKSAAGKARARAASGIGLERDMLRDPPGVWGHDFAALIVFPNLFESWFLFVCLRERFLARGARARRIAPGLLVFLFAGKLVQEHVVHVARLLDRFVLEDLVRRAWSALVGG
jgi:hypothetical protein